MNTRLSTQATSRQEPSMQRQHSTPEKPRGEQEPLALHSDSDGTLYVQRGPERLRVRPACCFPWSDKNDFISLRDLENREVYLVKRLSDLDPSSRSALERALASLRFVFRIEHVYAIEEDFEIRTWKVDTQQGPRSFQTELDRWPRPAPDGAYVIEDVAGDTFVLPPFQELDNKSQRMVWPFVD